MLEAVRCHFDAAVHITSGYRSQAYNTAVGGARNSQHLYGLAADFAVVSRDIETVHAWCDAQFRDCGLGIYRRGPRQWGWIHIDNRGSRARWTG